MLKKTYSKKGDKCRVTFSTHADIEAKEVALLGEFNAWDPETHPMKKRKSGAFSITVTLPKDESYRFRYLVDGSHWENEWEADDYVANEHGTTDSVVTI